MKLSSEKWNASNLRLSTLVVEVSVSKKCIRATIKAVGQSMFEVKWGRHLHSCLSSQPSYRVSLTGKFAFSDDVFFDSESCAYTVTVQNNCVTIDFEDTEVEAAVSLAKLSIKQSLCRKLTFPPNFGFFLQS